MIVRLPSVLIPEQFLARYPEPHVIVGYLDRAETPREYVRGGRRVGETVAVELSWSSALTWALWAFELPGDCSVCMADDWTTIWLAFAREDEAARVRALVGALAEVPVVGESASAATFTFDLLLHERLAAIRDRHIAALAAAEQAGGVTYVRPNGETVGSIRPERSQP